MTRVTVFLDTLFIYTLFFCFFFFFNDTATTEIYTLSLHDALPICVPAGRPLPRGGGPAPAGDGARFGRQRSEEHTSELQSRLHLVCRLLLEKKKKKSCQTNLQLNSLKTLVR